MPLITCYAKLNFHFPDLLSILPRRCEQYVKTHTCTCSITFNPYISKLLYRPISQTVFMLSIAINRAEHVCATVITKHNYMPMCNHKIVINIMLCLLNSTGHDYISRDL